MKKLLLILFLLVMPFQASWSAVAGYCQHDQDTSTRHFGHHAHKHVAHGVDDVQKPGKVHTDCGYCHGISQAAFDIVIQSFSAPSNAAYVASRFVLFTSYIADGPRRPDRHPVA